MYIHVGNTKIIKEKNIIGIFDTDTSTICKETKKFLNKKEKEDNLIMVKDEIPKSFILCDDEKVYFSQLSVKTLLQRIEKNKF